MVHRSQKDPLAADSDAPQLVLHRVPDLVRSKEEEREHGIFFEDDYDYLQHLKNRYDCVLFKNADVSLVASLLPI